MSAVTAWSYSRLAKYEQCPAAFKYQFIDKLVSYDDPRMQSDAAARGDRVHKGAQAFLTGVGDPSGWYEAKRHQDFAPLMEQLKANAPLVEQEWGFRANMTPTGWFAKDTWYRAKLDVAVLWEDRTASVVDWKTGKPYGTNDEQMEQFAWAVLSRYPELLEVETQLAYVDTGQEQRAEFARKDRELLDLKWRRRAAMMFDDPLYSPRPGTHCKRCVFSKAEGGPCEFGS